MSGLPPIILAIDTPEIDVAKRWLDATQGFIAGYKLGLEFFARHGAAGVIAVKEGCDVDLFLDLKLHDIPNTVGAATEQLAHLSPRFFTVHASGGAAMISAAVEKAPDIEITAVTILTSLNEVELFSVGFAQPPLESAVSLAVLATQAGARAIVCSPLEIAAIRAVVGADVSIISPGVRPRNSGADDQARTMDPAAAIAAGASYLVIGRPITQAWAQGSKAMRDAARSIAAEIAQV
ncbi:MAG: orotidine-5'-phosphate decarboxylase [Actinobacteria bacterium]|nr:orotidine-5'-phosphate decarboxylase [Actinomycetota bacterium]